MDEVQLLVKALAVEEGDAATQWWIDALPADGRELESDLRREIEEDDPIAWRRLRALAARPGPWSTNGSFIRWHRRVAAGEIEPPKGRAGRPRNSNRAQLICAAVVFYGLYGVPKETAYARIADALHMEPASVKRAFLRFRGMAAQVERVVKEFPERFDPHT